MRSMHPQFRSVTISWSSSHFGLNLGILGGSHLDTIHGTNKGGNGLFYFLYQFVASHEMIISYFA